MNLLFWRRRRHEVDTDPRDIDRLIFDIAEQKRRRDFDLLCRRLRDMNLFAPIGETNVEVPSGTTHVVAPGDAVKLPTVSLADGRSVVPFCVAQDDPRLGLRYAGMKAAEAFRMTLKMPEVHGLILQNRGISWVAFLRHDIERALKRYLS